MITGKQLLKEMFLIESVDLGKSVKTYELNGETYYRLENVIIQKEGEKNRNGRIYPKEILDREIQRLLPEAKLKMLRGELDHPDNRLEVRLQYVSHMITDIRWDGNLLRGDIEIIKTRAGLDAEAFIKQHSPIGISSRAEGSLEYVNETETIVQPDLHLETWDLVSTPSTYEAIINESVLKRAKQVTNNLYIDDLNRKKDILFEQINKILKGK